MNRAMCGRLYRTDEDKFDASQIGLLGWSQAGWIMPLAAVRANDIAFLISIQGQASLGPRRQSIRRGTR